MVTRHSHEVKQEPWNMQREWIYESELTGSPVIRIVYLPHPVIHLNLVTADLLI